MFFKPKNKNKGEDLNHQVEKYRRWWQDQTQIFPLIEGILQRKANRRRDLPIRASFIVKRIKIKKEFKIQDSKSNIHYGFLN